MEKDFAPVGTKACEGRCQRDVLMTSTGPIIICHACKRVVIDKR